MDEHNNKPYEQQLYAVFQSCLIKGQTELQEDDWITLCQKLHLTEQSDELKSCIREKKTEKRSISFEEFRTGLITLLAKGQELNTCTEKELTIDSQRHFSPLNVDTKKCESLPTDSNSNTDILYVKADIALDENRLKCLWEKINTCLKESVDSTTMYFISNCLGIPALPKQITQCIFEKLDQNCDGLISLDEFLIIFQNKKSLHEQLMLECNDESLKGLTKLDPKKRTFDILSSRKTSFNRSGLLSNMWKVTGITNTTALLSDGDVVASDVRLTELTTTLCDELKNLNESLDHTTIRSHITLLRDVLLMYQEELNNLNVSIENINGEKDKLRADLIEANERANALAQEIDEQHMRQEEIKQNLRKQLEQKHTEIIEELSDELSLERETNIAALKFKDEQIHVLQKESQEIKNKYVKTMKDNQMLEMEKESLRNQIEKLKQSNNDLLTQMKLLAAEHDEAQNIEVKQQQDVMCLLDRIKQLQSEAVLLRDQNDELTIELESLKSKDCHCRSARQDISSSTHSARNMPSDVIDDKDDSLTEEETDMFDMFLKHSTPTSCTSIEDDSSQNYKSDSKPTNELITKQLKNILTNSKCNSDSCVFKEEIFSVINRLQSNSTMHSLKEADCVKSIASELEIECEERTSESLRDFVVPKHKNTSLAKRVALTNSNNDLVSNVGENTNQDTKIISQNKVPSLRDYPPRKEDHNNTEQSKSIRDTILNNSMKVPNESNAKNNFICNKTDSIEDMMTHLKLQELEAAHATEKKVLTERCQVLERSLDLLKTEYEECEDYWAAKLEEERQLFEQEQKISDDKLAELITKMAEYEELICPEDKIKNNGRLSPIEERISLEQQYLDLEEEFEKWKAQVEEDISQKDKEMKDLQEKVQALQRPPMTDMSIQVSEEIICSHLVTQSNYVPTSSLNSSPSFEMSSKLPQYTENIRKLSEEFKLDRIMESSILSNDFISINDYKQNQIYVQHPAKDINSTCKNDKTNSHRKNEIGAKSAALLKEEDKRDTEFDLIQEALRLQNLKALNCHCMQNDAQRQVCCVDVNVLQNLKLRLQLQERKKSQLQEYYRKQQQHIERVLHHIMSQHQAEVSELQCLLRSTQERLQAQFETCADQAEKLARADILVKNLYIENARLSANLKRLEEHCHILTGFSAESTSI